MSHLFESSLEKIARIIARQYHIDVIFEGSGAYTDGKKIVLPSFTNITPELRADLNGYLDHEVAHCKFTKMDEIKYVISNFHKIMLNAAEDNRIEKAIINEFPGTAFNINPLNVKLRKRISDEWSEIAPLVRIILAVSDMMEGLEPRIDKDTKRYIEAVREKASVLGACNSTVELRVATEEIVRLIGKEEEKEREEKSSKSSKDGESKPEDSGKGEKGDSTGGDPESESPEGEGEGEGEGSSETPSEGESSPKKGKKLSDSSGRPSAIRRMLDEKPDAKDSKFDEHVHDIHSLINKEIKDAIKQEVKETARGVMSPIFEGSRSIPLTTRFDKVTDHSGKGDAKAYARLKQDVASLVAPIKSQLERVLKVKEDAKWTSDKERGRIDARSLNKMLVNPNNRRVFKSFTKTETNNVAVEILVDMSGSMVGRMRTAKMACVAMAEALKDLQIPFEVTGFYSEDDRNVINMARKADISRFNRTRERLELHVFKSFDTQSLSGIESLFVGVQNPDGECVSWAAKRVGNRKEKRKILLVLSDGEPSTGDGNRGILCSDLKNKVKLIEKSGIECIGIGIETDSVKHFYSDYIVLKNVKDLPKDAMRKLAKIVGG